MPTSASTIPSAWPRCLRAPAAAAYCGLTESDFLARVVAGEIRAGVRPTRPGTKDEARIVLYLRDHLDEWIDNLFGVAAQLQAEPPAVASLEDQRAELQTRMRQQQEERRKRKGRADGGQGALRHAAG